MVYNKDRFVSMRDSKIEVRVSFCFAHIRLTLSHLGTTLAYGEILEDDEKTDEGHC